ncbi:hypothetical protein [Pseudomonas fluorescens]|uniref:hypothetical protein n=1 Tax=Pseudomonas fluorescens TaxID=294 RepID=UPI000B0C380F|nr:hypothetical protein [Pseudomonas fluorescens]
MSNSAELKTQVNNAEKLIDEEFLNTPLLQLGYSQAIWTVLSVAEDMYLKSTVLQPLSHESQHIYLDGLINSLAHPAKALFHKRVAPEKRIKAQMFNEHYGWALDWLEQSQKYGMFCSIFPLWHKGKLHIDIEENLIKPEILSPFSGEYAYEAYNRFTRKDGNIEEKYLEPENLIDEIVRNMTITNLKFVLNFNAKLVSTLQYEHGKTLGQRYVLPSQWVVGGIRLKNSRKFSQRSKQCYTVGISRGCTSQCVRSIAWATRLQYG